MIQVEIVSIVGLALVSLVFLMILKQQRPDLALQLSILLGITIFLLMVTKVGAVVRVLDDLSQRAQVNPLYMGTLLKIIGVAYIAEFGAQVCRDAGEGALAGKVEFAAKVIVLVLALPIVVALLESILRLLP